MTEERLNEVHIDYTMPQSHTFKGIYDTSKKCFITNTTKINDELVYTEEYVKELKEYIKKLEIENNVLKEQMIAMTKHNYKYGISGGSNE